MHGVRLVNTPPKNTSGIATSGLPESWDDRWENWASITGQTYDDSKSNDMARRLFGGAHLRSGRRADGHHAHDVDGRAFHGGPSHGQHRHAAHAAHRHATGHARRHGQ